MRISDTMTTAQTTPQFRIGTDIGGTFTDLVVLEGGARPLLFKSPTTLHDRSEGVMTALSDAATHFGMPVRDFCERIEYLAHGTTAATNALIERKGAKTALLTTTGFRDTLLIQRSMTSWFGMGTNTGHYSARTNPDPIIPRDQIVEIDERVDYEGSVLIGLDRDAVTRELLALREAGVEAIAVCFLWSFINPEHELAVESILAEVWPEVYLTLSHKVAPVIGEYERTATTVINSYLGPVIRDYASNLENKLRVNGFAGEFSIMDSSGGVMTALDAGRRSVAMLTSGPAGGVLASSDLAKRMSIPNVITSDMGGTSFDVGLIVGNEPLVEAVSESGGYHVSTARIKVEAIGAGGGSIARIDDVGAIVVGPESAGSVPGPACYGRGGTVPTVTDADVVLGMIEPGTFLGGRMALYRDAAEAAIKEHIADPLGLTVIEAAAGIRNVADNQMADLLRKVTVQQGLDPREFTVFAYGGAGPTHAYAFTEAAGISTLVIPPTSTVHSALGTVTSDRYRSLTTTDVYRTPVGDPDPASHIDVERLGRSFADLQARCLADLENDPRAQFTRTAFLKFRKQTQELAIPVPEGKITTESARRIVEDFFAAYERVYGAGTVLRGGGVELRTLRVEGRIPAQRVSEPAKVVTTAATVLSTRTVYFPEVGSLETPVYSGDELGAGVALEGPAMIEYSGTTAVLGPGQSLTVDNDRSLIITIKDNA
jgi:N-methylhydantoinase A